ncbi:MAG: hypothetical protein AAFX87_10705 [Bacteroidota bacterium]
MKHFYKLKLALLSVFSLLYFASCESDESEVIPSSNTIALLSAPASILEGGTASFTVIYLGDPLTSATTVDFTVTGTGISLTGTATIPANEQQGTFDLMIPEDNTLEDEEIALTLTLTGASGGIEINENTPQNSAEFTLMEDVKNISVTNDTISISETFGNAGDTLMIPINLSNALDSEISIDYTISGTAVPGTDYMLVSANPLVLDAGTASAGIYIRILDDMDVEATAPQLIVTLDDITNADATDEETTLVEGDANRVIAYNIQDDLKTIGFDRLPTDTIMVSSAGSFTVSVNVTGNLLTGATIFLDDNLPNGVDDDLTSDELSFTINESSRTITFTVDQGVFDGSGDINATYVFDGLDANGDNEVSESMTNNEIRIKIINQD